MDSFFGVGLPELLVILLLAGVVMGPQQIRRVARMLGYWTAQLQRYYRDFVQQLNDEIDTMEAQEVKEAFKEVQKFGQQMNSLRQDFRNAPSTLMREGDKVLRQPLTPDRSPTAAPRPAPSSAGTAADAGNGENVIQPPRVVEIDDDPAV
ncbi:MAG: hypothetical protein KC418_17935 [Anaerolineales bacterium]|nr:hypothetical protein [Anaerolineales bacterium]MCB8953696.1 hypothetical protein [Ardenticatenales bacterium]